MAEVTTCNNYFIREPRDNGNSVEAWSMIRLPFEPKGWLLEMRNSLRTAIRQIEHSDGKGLYALYTSDEAGLCDVENILMYNVGTGAFSNLCRTSLCFERRMSSAPQMPQLQHKMAHYYYYSVVDSKEGLRFWKKRIA